MRNYTKEMIQMTENQNQDFVVFTGEYQGTTNVRVLKLLYSLKKHKFITPFATHGDRVAGDVEYHVFPANYLVFSIWKHHNRSEFRLGLLSVKQETTDYTKSVTVYFTNDEYLDKSVVALDFVSSLPGYHFIRHESLFKKLYDEKDTAFLLEFLNRYDGKEFSEEGEME